MTDRLAPEVWSAQSILVGLAIHSLMWSVLLLWLFWPSSSAYVLCAPVLYFFFYSTDHLHLGWGIAGLAVSTALVALVILSLVKRLRWVVLLTHGALLLYYLIGAVLIAFDVEW